MRRFILILAPTLAAVGCAGATQRSERSKNGATSEFAATSDARGGSSTTPAATTTGTAGDTRPTAPATASTESGSVDNSDEYVGALPPGAVAGINLVDCGVAVLPPGVDLPKDGFTYGCRVALSENNETLTDADITDVHLVDKGSGTSRRVTFAVNPKPDSFQVLFTLSEQQVSSTSSILMGYMLRGVKYVDMALMPLPLFFLPQLSLHADRGGKLAVGDTVTLTLSRSSGSFPAARLRLSVEDTHALLHLTGKGTCYKPAANPKEGGSSLVTAVANGCTIEMARTANQPLSYGKFASSTGKVIVHAAYFDGLTERSVKSEITVEKY